MASSITTRALAIEHVITADLDDGQPCPPFIENNVVWHVVRRAGGRTLWRRISHTIDSIVDVGAVDDVS